MIFIARDNSLESIQKTFFRSVVRKKKKNQTIITLKYRIALKDKILNRNRWNLLEPTNDHTFQSELSDLKRWRLNGSFLRISEDDPSPRTNRRNPTRKRLKYIDLDTSWITLSPRVHTNRIPTRPCSEHVEASSFGDHHVSKQNGLELDIHEYIYIFC